MKIKNQIAVIAQATIDLFPVVTCEQRSCYRGYPKMQPTLIVDGEERYYMHQMGEGCLDCKDCHELWQLRLQAI